ncbi:hypothetical protein VNO78_18562 [Psophocarpus tetragonolobus]|uniref:Uncharacterized protein n=1 Tax=Psophocarpus tetragonolobus TaxID=3891 RepID=A0AAN9XLM9_PSOTE
MHPLRTWLKTSQFVLVNCKSREEQEIHGCLGDTIVDDLFAPLIGRLTAKLHLTRGEFEEVGTEDALEAVDNTNTSHSFPQQRKGENTVLFSSHCFRIAFHLVELHN